MIDLARLAAILVLIVLLLRLRWNLGLVLVLASAATALLFGLEDLLVLAVESMRAIVDPLTLRLVAIVLLITFLGEILRATLQLEGLVRSLGDLLADRRWLLALMPMLIGMLPMVGGAMFSAPMVDEASREIEVSHERRTFLNYWFRHTWEPVFPLYPSLVLAAGLMGVSVQALTVSQWPLFVAALAGGVLFGLVGIGRPGLPPDSGGVLRDGPPPDRRETLQLLLHSVWPILLVLILSVALRVDLIVSLLITIVLLAIIQRLGPAKLWDLTRGMPFGTVPIIVGAMIFRRMLEAAGAIEAVSSSLAALGIPLVIVVFAVPMFAGLLTGLLAAAFAIGLPIVLPLLGVDPIASGYGLVAYAGGFAGLMLSPLHLCLALTRVYFEAEWGGVYRRLVPAVLLLVIAAAITFWLGS